MANYRFNPNKKKTGFKVYKEETPSSGGLTKAVKLVAVIVAVAFVAYLGSSITGAFLYSNPDYDEFSDDINFPNLVKKEANLELFKCRKDFSKSSVDLSSCDLFLTDMKDTFLAVSDRKDVLDKELEQIQAKYDTCSANEGSAKSSLDACNSEKAVKESHLATCNTLLREKDEKYQDYESERTVIIQNYANSVCCTLKHMSNSDLRYYKVVDNKIICTENEGTEFNC